MGVELNKTEAAMALSRLVGDIIADAGETIERFNAAQLAGVLEREIVKSQSRGLGNLRIVMSLVDAAALARCLRQRGK